MKNIQYIFISNGYRGGNSTFSTNHMLYLNSLKKKIILIDDNPKKTYQNLPKNIKILKIKNNIFYLDTHRKLKKILVNNLDNKIIFITNYAFIIKYFYIFFTLKKNTKIVLTIHSGLLNLNIKNYIAGFIFSIIYRKIDHLFFGSESSKNWWKNYFPWMQIKKNLVHKNGVVLNKNLNTKKVNKKLNISFVGRLEEENNPKFFIDIAEEFLKHKKNVVFNIYGDGSLNKKLKALSKNNKIIFHGWSEKKRIFSNTDIILITSPINNFPYVAIEAKSFGIPVISCSKGDINKIIKNNVDGLIKYTNSKKKMIELIVKIEKNYKFFSKNCLHRSKKYNVDKLCKKFWDSITD